MAAPRIYHPSFPHALYDNNPFVPMLAYLSRPPHWHPPPPPPVPHKVWIIDCKSCLTFITNRGMKVSRRSSSNRNVAYLLLSIQGGFTLTSKCFSLLLRRSSNKLFSVHDKPRCPASSTLSFVPDSSTNMRMPYSDSLLPWLWLYCRIHDCRSRKLFLSPSCPRKYS